MPIAGGEYVFTGLDAAGQPIPGAIGTDIWVGVDPPDPPTNVRADLTEGGILVSWDDSPAIPGSFDLTAEPPLGFYQLWVNRVETGEAVYGANLIYESSHLIPLEGTDFVEGEDWGSSLGELGDGAYTIGACVFSMAPADSLGAGFEYNSSDIDEHIVFAVEGGEIAIL